LSHIAAGARQMAAAVGATAVEVEDLTLAAADPSMPVSTRYWAPPSPQLLAGPVAFAIRNFWSKFS
jgi:hypothetical protein